MVFRVENVEFKSGDNVRLGNGEEAVVKAKVTGPTGFTSYRVQMTSGPRSGDQVGATPAAMVKLSRRRARMRRVAVALGDHQFRCRVARTSFEHAQGLQEAEPLGDGEGMVFVFDPPRATSFHMGRVAFPIDIVFANAGEVVKVVHDVQPGDRGLYAAAPVDHVVELAGGTCRKLGISPPLSQHYYTVDIPHEVGDDPDNMGESRDPSDRFMSGVPPDVSPLADDMSNDQWQSQWGYDPTVSDHAEGRGIGLRPSAALIADPAEYITSMVEAMAREPRPIDWHRDPLNPNLSYATVTTNDIGDWLNAMGDMRGSEITDAYDAASSRRGMQLLGDGLVDIGVATETKVAHHPQTDEDVLVLYTRHDDENGHG